MLRAPFPIRLHLHFDEATHALKCHPELVHSHSDDLTEYRARQDEVSAALALIQRDVVRPVLAPFLGLLMGPRERRDMRASVAAALTKGTGPWAHLIDVSLADEDNPPGMRD